jgi:hypothetical protein
MSRSTNSQEDANKIPAKLVRHASISCSRGAQKYSIGSEILDGHTQWSVCLIICEHSVARV